MTSIKELLLRRPWLTPFIFYIVKGVKDKSEIIKHLDCSSSLVKSALYYLKKETGDLDQFKDVCLVKRGRYYVTKVGTTYIVAKVLRRRVRVYTVPEALLSQEVVQPKLRHRVRVLRSVLTEYEEKAGSC